jgi:hypothetical protein
MLSDKKAGPFEMQVEWVKVASPGELAGPAASLVPASGSIIPG